MKKRIYLRMLIWVVTTGILFTRCASKPEPALASKKQADAGVAKKTALEQWEASPDGVRYLTWKASPEGQKVMAASALLQPSIQDSSLLEAVVTSLSLPAGSRLGLGIMVKIQGEDYILSFGPETAAEHQTEAKHAFKQLHTLQVNDRIKIRGGSVTHAPKYAYPIVSGDYVERNGVILYQRPPREDGC